MRPAVFLDRDGTLVEERVHLRSLDQLAPFLWTADSIRLLNRAGFATVVVTNQSGVARGLFTEAFVGEVHAALDARLAEGRARIDRYYLCPHHPEGVLDQYRLTCRCRKPAPGMIEQACREMDLDPARSFMVGDSWSDVAAGQAAGVRSVLVRTGHGEREAAHPPDGARADVILSNLMEAVAWILRTCERS